MVYKLVCDLNYVWKVADVILIVLLTNTKHEIHFTVIVYQTVGAV